MKRLSGDQKGKVAPSVPSSGLASEEASARTQSCTLLPVAAVKASQIPSGETAVWPKLVFSGGRMENFMTRASGVGLRVKYAHANPSIPINNTVATAHANRARPNKSDQPARSGAAGAAACVSSRAPRGVDNASSAKPRSYAV